jgi:hypothetical protein
MMVGPGENITGIQSDAGSLLNSFKAYEFDYFSGSQIGIYIGDILVDDIESIQYTVTQTKRPIFGYASQYFHKMADGQVLVEGAFSIPFKEADYILATLQRYRDTHTPINTPAGPQPLGETPDYLVLRENIERRMMEGVKKDLPIYDLYTDLSALSDEQFENVAEVFEDVLWQQPSMDFLTGNVSPGVKNVSDYVRRADQYPPVDIYILYGDIANKAANHTIKKLIDVSIIGEGQAIVVGGVPISEQYRFIAKNAA